MKHSHNFLGEGHEDKEWRTWAVIGLCTMSMIIEISCGIAFGSLALVADGVHMGTHVIAFFITASAYSYSRFHAENPKFVFGTGKVGELASFTCAILLVVISIVIIYEGIFQLIYPVDLDFVPAFIVSFVGLTVNIASGCLLVLPCGGGNVDGGMAHGHSHNHNEHEFLEELDLEMNEAAGSHEGHDHGHGHGHGHGHDETFVVEATDGNIELSIFEDGVPPEFRVRFLDWTDGPVNLRNLAREIKVKTIRPDGSTQVFLFAAGKNETYLHGMVDIPEPHSFTAEVMFRGETLPIVFAEASEHGSHGDHHGYEHGKPALEDDEGHVVTASSHKYEQDNNFRAAVMHVVADAFVSVLTIIAIGIAGTVPGAWWLNPAVGMVGSLVIISWAYQLIMDTTGTLLDLCPDPALNDKLREILQADKESFVTDMHVWKLGPGKLGMIVSIMCAGEGRTRDYYAQKLSKFKALAHLTVELLPYDANYVHDHAHGGTAEAAEDDHGHNHDHGHGHGQGGHKGKEGDGFVYAPMHT